MMTMRRYFFAVALLALVGLSACKTSPTDRMAARLAGATRAEGNLIALGAHTVQVEIQRPGAFANQTSLPLDPQADAVVGGKVVSLGHLRTGTNVIIWRDADTRRVIRIEAK